MQYFYTVLATLAVLVLGVLMFPYTGIYNIAATAGHTDFARWFLSTTMERSVEVRADDVAVPTDLASPERVRSGAIAYAQMCQMCHGAPGHERGVVGTGLTPTPPRLSEAATHWEPDEVFWILQHGIKMAGMPAFGPTHSDEELWELAAFVEQLPEMTEARYQRLTAQTASDSTAASGDGHDHQH